MTEGNPGPDRFENFRRYVPLATWAIVLLLLLFIPLKVIKYGYLPPDDALRHAAKAVSTHSWEQIMVMGPGWHIDPNLGWHRFLHAFHEAFNWDAEALVVFSVIMLYVVGNWSIASCLRRPEAWLVAIILVSLVSDLTSRFMLGRPFVLTIAALGVILLQWQRRGPAPARWHDVLWMTPLIAIAVCLHGVWYLWALPIAAFFLAQQFRWCFLLATSWVLGTLLGSALTGHPVASILQAIQLALRAVGMHDTQATLVGELKPSGGDIFTLLFLGGLVVWRQLWKSGGPPLLRHPAFWLTIIGWILGCETFRFWEDWGAPALMFLIAMESQSFFESRLVIDSLQRLGLVAVLALTCYVVTTNDVNSRWTNHLTWQYLDLHDQQNTDLKGWMPDPGGVLYSADMGIFFKTFFKNPDGDWRYALGFEPTLMTDDNFKVYYKAMWNFGDLKALQPWVDKLQPADRLVVGGSRSSPPNIPRLEWNYPITGVWIGRLPRTVEPGTAPPMAPAGTNAVPSRPLSD